MIDQKPLFPCCVCSEDYSWPANELRTYKDETWCENCWDETDMNLDEDIFWSDLERFIPEADRKIAVLEAEIERLKKFEHEYICKRCGIRQNSNEGEPTF